MLDRLMCRLCGFAFRSILLVNWQSKDSVFCCRACMALWKKGIHPRQLENRKDTHAATA